MNLQGYLHLDYNGQSYSLVVKTFVKNATYYFYITDKSGSNQLLGDKTLELTYNDSFCTPDKNDLKIKQQISADIVSAIQTMLMDNKQLWFY